MSLLPMCVTHITAVLMATIQGKDTLYVRVFSLSNDVP